MMPSVCFPCFHTPSREHGHGHQASFKTCVSRLQCPSMASQRACVFFFPSSRDFIQMVVAIQNSYDMTRWRLNHPFLKNISQTGPFPQVEVNRTSKIDKTMKSMNHIWDISATYCRFKLKHQNNVVFQKQKSPVYCYHSESCR